MYRPIYLSSLMTSQSVPLINTLALLALLIISYPSYSHSLSSSEHQQASRGEQYIEQLSASRL